MEALLFGVMFKTVAVSNGGELSPHISQTIFFSRTNENYTLFVKMIFFMLVNVKIMSLLRKPYLNVYMFLVTTPYQVTRKSTKAFLYCGDMPRPWSHKKICFHNWSCQLKKKNHIFGIFWTKTRLHHLSNNARSHGYAFSLLLTYSSKAPLHILVYYLWII